METSSYMVRNWNQNPILGTRYTIHEKDSLAFKQIPEVPVNDPYMSSLTT